MNYYALSVDQSMPNYQATPPIRPTSAPGSGQESGEVRKKRKYRSRIRARSPSTVQRLRKVRRGKANDRERNRMHSLNDALETLRRTLPCFPDDTKLTKIETLKMALDYISLLQDLLQNPNAGTSPTKPTELISQYATSPCTLSPAPWSPSSVTHSVSCPTPIPAAEPLVVSVPTLAQAGPFLQDCWQPGPSHVPHITEVPQPTIPDGYFYGQAEFAGFPQVNQHHSDYGYYC